MKRRVYYILHVAAATIQERYAGGGHVGPIRRRRAADDS